MSARARRGRMRIDEGIWGDGEPKPQTFDPGWSWLNSLSTKHERPLFNEEQRPECQTVEISVRLRRLSSPCAAQQPYGLRRARRACEG